MLTIGGESERYGPSPRVEPPSKAIRCLYPDRPTLYLILRLHCRPPCICTEPPHHPSARKSHGQSRREPILVSHFQPTLPIRTTWPRWVTPYGHLRQQGMRFPGSHASAFPLQAPTGNEARDLLPSGSRSDCPGPLPRHSPTPCTAQHATPPYTPH